MNIFSAIAMGLREIWGHKVRSLLTLFCILLGVMSVVVTVAYMRSLTQSWRTYLNERGGLERIRVQSESLPDELEHLESLSPGRTVADAVAIRRHVDHIANVSAVVELFSSRIYRNGKSARAGRSGLEGVEPQTLEIERYEMARGRFVTDIDNLRCNQVIVLGTWVRDELFEKFEEPLGETVIIEGIPFEVVGILKHYAMEHGRDWISWKNQTAFIPLNTAQRKIRNSDRLDELDVQVEDVAYLDRVVGQIENVVRAVHRGVPDFEADTSESWSEDIEKQERSQLTAGAAISLVTIIVGGIGIMNLMLASINERVREIGVRKAVGATGRDIFFQFCVESVTLSLVGGVLGVAAGQGLIYWLQQVMVETAPPVFNLFGVVAGFSASVTIGLLAGIYPAFRAARLDPIEALRYE